MSGAFYKAGRALQLIALGTLPFSLWVGWIGHNEAGSILIFVGSILIFALGTVLTGSAKR